MSPFPSDVMSTLTNNLPRKLSPTYSRELERFLASILVPIRYFHEVRGRNYTGTKP